MSLLISIAVSIVVAFIMYWVLESYGKGTLYKVNFVLSLLGTIFQNLKSLNIKTIIVAIIASLISSLISTAVADWAYRKTDSFWKFFGLLLLVAIVIVIVIIAIGVIISMIIGGSSTLNILK
jgi:ABC-type spermidine/putrescine transport system permease subunit II